MALGAWNGALSGVGCGKWRGLLAIAQAARRRAIPQLLIFEVRKTHAQARIVRLYARSALARSSGRRFATKKKVREV